MHIPRTGGSSLTWAFRHVIAGVPEHAKNKELPRSHRGYSWHNAFHLESAVHVLGNDDLAKKLFDQFPDYFTFTFIRNPWDRLMSFVALGNNLRIISHFQFNKVVKHLLKIDRFASNSKILLDSEGNIPVDYVARFENYVDEIHYLAKHLGITDYEIYRIQTSSKEDRNYRDWYDDETKELVAEHYQDDIKNFGYEY